MVVALVAQASSRLNTPRRGLWVGAVTVAALLLALASVLPGHAQVVTPPGPSVTVHGTGEATAPAETATVQLLIGQGGHAFGFAEDGSGGSSFSSGSGVSMSEEGMVAEISPEDPAAATPAATPSAMPDGDEDASAQGEGRRGRRGRPDRQALTAERLQPVVDAVVAGAGIEPGAVSVDLSPLATEPFGGGQESVRLDFEVAQPDPEALGAVIAAASDAAAANGMVVEVAGVQYNPADCAVVEQEAAESAVVDAREQADRMAELLGVTLGSVVGASSDPYFGFAPEQSGCTGQQSSFYDSAYGGLGITVPVFDPGAPAEVEVYAVLTISYEIVGEQA